MIGSSADALPSQPRHRKPRVGVVAIPALNQIVVRRYRDAQRIAAVAIHAQRRDGAKVAVRVAIRAGQRAVQAWQVTAHRSVIEAHRQEGGLLMALPTARRKSVLMNVILFVAGDAHLPRAAALLAALVAAIAAHLVVSTTQGKIAGIVGLLDVAEAGRGVAALALGAVSALVHRRFPMTAIAGLGRGLEAAIVVTVRADGQGMSPVDFEDGLFVVAKARLASFRMAALAFVAKGLLVNVVLLVAPSRAASTRRIRKAGIWMTVNALGHRAVATSQWEVGVLLVREVHGLPLAGAMASGTGIAETPLMQRILVATRPALGGCALVDFAHVAALAFDFSVLQRERESGLFTVEDLERLLGHALLTWFCVAAQALIVLVFAAVRFFVLVTTQAAYGLKLKLLKVRTLLTAVTTSALDRLVLAREGEFGVLLVIENLPFPTTCLMTGLAGRSLGARGRELFKAILVSALRSMTIDACLLWLALLECRCVTIRTSEFSVSSQERKLGLPLVREANLAKRSLLG